VLEGVPYDSIEIKQADKELAMHLLFTEKWTPDMILKDHPDFSEYITYPVNYIYMQEVAAINLPTYWKRVDAPVLLIHGSADFVSDAFDHTYLRDMINYYHPGRASYLELPKTDHFFLSAEDEADAYKVLTDGADGREFNSAILKPIVDFCKQAAGVTPASGDSQ
jgi:pimeloyl-ACP methyl ester carboxylesterase